MTGVEKKSEVQLRSLRIITEIEDELRQAHRLKVLDIGEYFSKFYIQ